MTCLIRRSATALAILCALGRPALADSASYTVTSGWQKIASAGATVMLQTPVGVILTTSAASPSGQAGQELLPNNRVGPITLGADLYARSGTVVVTTGLVGSTASGAVGSTGTDASANPPTIPNVGAGFAASGPYASYVLVKTIAAGTRNAIEVDNTSGAQIAVVRDDGTAASGAAPVNASVFPLGGGAAAGAQGGSWSSTTFKGRVQIYAPALSAQVTVMVD